MKNGKAGVSEVVGVQTASAGKKICLVLEFYSLQTGVYWGHHSHIDSFEGLGWDLHSFSFPDKSQPYSVGYIGFLIFSYFDESSLLFLRI